MTECIQPGVTWLFCGERACPALGSEAAPKAVIRIHLEKRSVLDGAASRPQKLLSGFTWKNVVLLMGPLRGPI
ncbi:hypothetical protein, partial [Pseudomonas sp. NFX5]|uniref:hypothetical protein n=1 Tax=Pseudomonas sp. NFX5 TaxID=2816961 RepID=UPI003B8C67F6